METLTEYLEHDRDKVLQELSAAGSPEKAYPVLEREVDRLLVRYNESCGSELLRMAAASSLQQVRMSLPLMDCIAETHVYEDTSVSGSPRRSSTLSRVLLIGSAALLALLAASELLPVPLILGGGAARILMGGGSALCALAGGRLSGRPGPRARAAQIVQTDIDAQRVYRQLRAGILSADRSLKDFTALESSRQLALTGPDSQEGLSPAETELFASLLEGAYSGDGRYALDQLQQVRWYLHRVGVTLSEDTQSHPEWFDRIPSAQEGVLRPALIDANGTLLHRGLAGISH